MLRVNSTSILVLNSHLHISHSVALDAEQYKNHIRQKFPGLRLRNSKSCKTEKTGRKIKDSKTAVKLHTVLGRNIILNIVCLSHIDSKTTGPICLLFVPSDRLIDEEGLGV